MPSIDLLPLPEQEQKQLLIAVKDIMHNGGRIPQDVSNELIMAAILELNGCVVRNANQSRRNALTMRYLTAGLLLMSAVIIASHGDDWGLFAVLSKFIVP